MAAISLARTHAPKKLADFTRDPAVTEAIIDVARSAHLNLILCGDADSGKSSTLVALVDTLQMPTLLIDELSENGVSFFRHDVLTFCRRGREGHRVLVAVDNIDALSEQCQHVVRGMVDSFPGKVQFIATARHPGRLVQGLGPRFCAVHLDRLSEAQMGSVLDTVAAASGLTIPEEACRALVRDCGSSVRAMLSALERVRIMGHTGGATSASGAADCAVFTALIGHLTEADGMSRARETMRTLTDRGHGTSDILDGLFRSLPYIDALTDMQRYDIVALVTQYAGKSHQHPNPEHLNLMLLCELTHLLGV